MVRPSLTHMNSVWASSCACATTVSSVQHLRLHVTCLTQLCRQPHRVWDLATGTCTFSMAGAELIERVVLSWDEATIISEHWHAVWWATRHFFVHLGEKIFVGTHQFEASCTITSMQDMLRGMRFYFCSMTCANSNQVVELRSYCDRLEPACQDQPCGEAHELCDYKKNIVPCSTASLAVASIFFYEHMDALTQNKKLHSSPLRSKGFNPLCHLITFSNDVRVILGHFFVLHARPSTCSPACACWSPRQVVVLA